MGVRRQGRRISLRILGILGAVSARCVLGMWGGTLGVLARGTTPEEIVPRAWQADELARLEVPLVTPARSAQHVSPEFYYRMSVRRIYKSYPIYAPGREPPGYQDWLRRQDPEVAFNSETLHTDAEWIAAGEAVFDAPLGYGATFKLSQVSDRAWYEANQVPLTADGIMPFSRYVIRKKGVIEVGSGGCLMCHARVMPGGTLLKGAQGNFPVDRVIAYNLRAQAAEAPNAVQFLQSIRLGQRLFFSMPWLRPDPAARIDTMTLEDIARAYDAIPPGVTTRVNLSVFTPAQIPDLIGVQERRHLDHTGIVEQRSIGDLMRYAALVQGANSFDRFGDFALIDPLPNASDVERYSDEQLYALARYLYALKPPANPNRVDRAAARGRKIFEREGCAVCHMPPLYTSNALTPAAGFTVPPEHLKRYRVIPRSVGTNPDLALRTRKGTGYYKVPSLKGVWYRGPFQHGGAAKTLEEWFDPSRTSTVPGHPFGLALNTSDRAALISFLRAL
jgi:hypothetical protein